MAHGGRTRGSPASWDVASKRLLGFLLQPYCYTSPRYRYVILAVDPELRDYIYLSQTYPSRVNLSPAQPATWLAANLGNPVEESPIPITVTVPEQASPLEYTVEQDGSEVLLGVRPPYEYAVISDLTGQVISAIYADYPTAISGLPESRAAYSLIASEFDVVWGLGPQGGAEPPVHDNSWPPDYEWPPDPFLYPSQRSNFAPWYYSLYSGMVFPPLNSIPYLRIIHADSP